MDILNTFLEITVYSGIIFVVTMLLKKLCKNSMSPWLHYTVWFVLVIRLMLPFTLESTFHVFSLPAQTQIETASVTQPEALAPAAETSAADTASDAQAKTVNPVEPSDKTVSPAPASASAKAASLSTQDFLLIVWLSGVGVCLMYLATLYTALRRRMRRNAAPPSQRLMALFDQTKAELDIRANIKLICQYEYGTPALLLPRTILMPVDTLVAMNDEQVKFALHHELMHYKHRDHLMCLLLSVLNAVHWFNPFVWLAFRQMRSDMEVKCDGAVVKRLTAAQKSRYASLIVSLFTQSQRRQLVLGMAQDNMKKVAEHRVRGIFMGAKSRRSARLVSALVVVLLAVTCFTTACQPTPEEPPVIHRVEDIPKEAILETATPPPEVKNVVEPAAYSVKEHWKETIEKNDFLSIEVDADILMPEAAAYPVERLERIVLTQEKVNELIAYFTEPGTKFYTGEYVKLKSEYEEELIDMKLSLQNVLNGGDGEDPDSIRSYIKEVERKLAQAPESHTYTYVEPVFTFETDYETGEPRKEYGENIIFVSIELPDGSRHGSVYASRYEKGKNTSTGFSYSRFSGGWNLESYFTWYDEELRREMENPPWYAESDGGEWQEEMTSQREYVDAGLKSMQRNNMDLRAAADSAIKLLDELGIEGMQLNRYEKAMFSRELDQEDYSIPGCYVEFVRECGGIPSLSQSGGSFSREQDYSELYCAPFDLESVKLLISEEGVEFFSWRGMAQVVERVAENTTLMPLDEMKQRILNHVYFMNGAWLDHAQQDTKHVKIEEMRLVTTYINAKDDSERVLIVPAWHVMAQEEYLFDQTDTWRQGNKEEFMINALDGSGILMPGILERIQNRPR